MKPADEFDSFASTYDADLDQALSASGEAKDYFARSRVAWLGNRLQGLVNQPESVIDYDCGIGGTAALLRDELRRKVCCRPGSICSLT